MQGGSSSATPYTDTLVPALLLLVLCLLAAFSKGAA